ncbi:unnamed protein product (macronuclear) [Paramecium tetraurelia]|uniref:Transmembrane protein n=1 Tax=Paramecium tetraurelia TaxID=5888 RepID=A0CTJ9_PARTE|nr:uncharacterized protein GSPATT00010350001 [Paramecium tetraurelia]CAK74116.1 unnamed protein product [Paramecium tetraurelia]|eukprot:XP_001441513.1 hypothetical protein (macronuclear) [Paramecium tetraurelia strain d4-2]
MINLNEEEKQQQSKLINIFFQHAKQGLIILLMNNLIKEELFFLQITLYLTIIMLAFNFIAAIFLLCVRRDFPRLEYFLIYTLNLFLFLTLLVYSMKFFIELNDTNKQLSLYVKTYILILLQKEIEILTIKIFPYDIANRQVNCFTSFIFVFLILLDEDPIQCKQQFAVLLLFHLINHTFQLILNTLFSLLILNQKKQQKELRTFSKQISIFISFQYTSNCFLHDSNNFIHFYYYKDNSIKRRGLSMFIFYDSILLMFCSNQLCGLKAHQQIRKLLIKIVKIRVLVKQQFIYFQDAASLQKNNAIQKDRQSFKSMSSVINNPMDNSECNSQAPNFGKDENKQLQKLGTSQFGASQYNQGMEHSWANVYHQNPFNQQNSKDNNNNQKRESKSVDESFIRQEESQIPENLSQLNNPMDSDSQILK